MVPPPCAPFWRFGGDAVSVFWRFVAIYMVVPVVFVLVLLADELRRSMARSSGGVAPKARRRGDRCSATPVPRDLGPRSVP